MSPALPEPARSVSLPARLVARAFLAVIGARVRYRRETLQCLATGPAIVLCNHVSYLDGLLVAFASPVPLSFGVDTEFARRNPWTRLGMAVLAALGFGSVFPLDQHSPAGLRHLLRELQAGRSVALFPEGAISPDGKPLPPMAGADWLAERSGCRAVRLRIDGAQHSKVFGKAGQAWRPPIWLTF